MSAEEEIRRRIGERGSITFAEFMEVALFWPQGGYYTGTERVGASGDFYTSPLAHPAFGALLAVQLFQMWRIMGCLSPFTVVEMGAGSGLLCHDLVSYSSNLPEGFGQSLHYLCLDRRSASGVERTSLYPPLARGDYRGVSTPGEVGPVVARLAAVIPSTNLSQRGTKGDFLRKGELGGIPLRGIRGCFLSNEFLDAFPVHQVTVHQGRLQEVYVTQRGEELVETLGDPSSPELAARLAHLGIELAEGQTAEVNLGLTAWAEQVSAALEAGFVLTVDYGHPAAELYSPQRHRGTLTTFYHHTQTDAPFRHIGSQDVTAQVDFTSVVNAGRQAGLELLGFTRQRQFLSNLELGHFQRRLSTLGLRPREVQANRSAMLDLVRPGGLGDFKVLAQGKNVGQPMLWGFEPSAEAASLASQLPVPLLTAQHLPLLEARYPHTEFEFELESLWPSPDDQLD